MVVGNKSKDEPLMISPDISPQVADEGLMRTLTAYFLGGFKSEECYNLYHETDLACNEVWNLRLPDFRRPATFYEHSVSLAKHLYESGQHPQIKSGEFYAVYFSDCPLRGRADRRAGVLQVGDARHVPRCRPRGRRGPHRGPRGHRHQAAGQGGRHLQRGARCGLRGPHRR